MVSPLSLIEALARQLTGNFDGDIAELKAQYATCQNSFFTSAYEKLIFKVYRAEYLVSPKKADFDYKKYLAIDESYYERCNADVEKAFDHQKADELYAEALSAVKEKNYAQAGALFYQSAIEGNANAQYNYGVSVYNGEVGEADFLESAFWYWLSAQGGNPKAMLNLGVQYRNGLGVKQSGEKMLYWYAQGAKKFLPDAVYNIGLTLVNEEVLPGNVAFGNAFREAAYRLDEPEVQSFVSKNADEIIEAVRAVFD